MEINRLRPGIIPRSSLVKLSTATLLIYPLSVPQTQI